MKNKRPININPLSIQLPIGALVSITHRLSGILVFLLIPVMLWAFQQSLLSAEHFEKIKNCFTGNGCKIILMIFFAGGIFHVVAGIRHLLMDIHLGDSKNAGRMGAFAVIVITLLLLIAAFWMWG